MPLVVVQYGRLLGRRPDAVIGEPGDLPSRRSSQGREKPLQGREGGDASPP